MLSLDVDDEDEVGVAAAVSEESAVRTSGLDGGRLATGRSNGDWHAGHCTIGHLAFPTSTAGDSVFFLGAAFPFLF